MEESTRYFIFGALIIVMLVVGAPIMLNLAKEEPDYAADSQAQARVQQAVNTYARAAGAYPLSLDTLVPGYLESIPRSSTGKAFPYNYETGQVSLPYTPPSGEKLTIAPASGGGVPGGMGDAITGLSVQNELNF